MVRYVMVRQDLWLIRIMIEEWINARFHPNPTAEQITKADRNACHALCRNGKVRATLRRLSSTVPQEHKSSGFQTEIIELSHIAIRDNQLYNVG